MKATFPRTYSNAEEFFVKVDPGKYNRPSLACIVAGGLAFLLGSFHLDDVNQLLQHGTLSPTLGICFAVLVVSMLALSVIQQMEINNLNDISADYNGWLAANYGLVSVDGLFSHKGLPKAPMDFTDMNGETVTRTLAYGTEWKRSSAFSKNPVPYLRVTLEVPEENLTETHAGIPTGEKVKQEQV
jgi:hypothetical protein